jgi:hypothetical protein
MNVYITAKQIKKRGNQVVPYPCVLQIVPQTLRQLITILVIDGVERYNQRLQAKEGAAILTKHDMDAMSQVGKIGFGIPFGSRQADLQEALETAFQGFEDGLYRLFVGEQEIESLDAPLHLQEEDTITIIRLVMLTGGYF